MTPEVLVWIGGLSFVASYFSFWAQLPSAPEPEAPSGPEVTYWVPPPLRMRWAEREETRPSRRGPPSSPPWLLELEKGEWHLSVTVLADAPARAVRVSDGKSVVVSDLRWTGAVGIEGSAPRRRVRVKPGQA